MPNDEQPTIHVADPNEIIIPPKRQRTSYDPTEMKKLEQSIQKLGQLQPGVCRKNGDGTISLIAGYRRLTACKNIDKNYCYILKDEIVDPVLREEMELHENLCRENLSFLDTAAAQARLHKLYMETRGTGPSIKGQASWSLQKTAQELQCSAATLHNNIELEQFSKTVPAVRDAKNKSEATKIVKRLKEQVLQQEAIKQIRQKAPEDNVCKTTGDEMADLEQQLACAANEFAKHTHTGDFQVILPELDQLYDVVFFDPPWGVDFQDAFQLSGSQQGYSDKRKDFFRNLQGWLTTIYDHMKTDSHLYIKFGIVHHFWVVRMLMRTGFQTNGIPIMWHKDGAHRTRTPVKWPGRCYEPIMLAHKGAKPLQKEGRPDIITTLPPSPKMKSIHPSAMHPGLPLELLLRSCFPGDSVLDPMCGSGMTGVAAEHLRKELGLNYTLIDEKEAFTNLTIKNLLKGYSKITDPSNQKADTGTNFKSLKPGTPEWIEMWNTHPELQDAMMEWTKTGG